MTLPVTLIGFSASGNRMKGNTNWVWCN